MKEYGGEKKDNKKERIEKKIIFFHCFFIVKIHVTIKIIELEN